MGPSYCDSAKFCIICCCALQACTSTTTSLWAAQNKQACLDLVAKMSLPGGNVLAGRPGAICHALKACTSSCLVLDPAVASEPDDGWVKQPVDLCTANGIVAPPVVSTEAGVDSVCTTDADCTDANNKCDFSTTTADCDCDSSTGLDTKCVQHRLLEPATATCTHTAAQPSCSCASSCWDSRTDIMAAH